MLNRGAGHLVITEEGIRAINNTLGNLVLDSGAKAALLMEKSGPDDFRPRRDQRLRYHVALRAHHGLLQLDQGDRLAAG